MLSFLRAARRGRRPSLSLLGPRQRRRPRWKLSQVAGQFSVVVTAGLITAFALLLALLFAKRLRFWKEQILLKIAITDSNNAIAHEATRVQVLQKIATAESDNATAHEVTRAQIQSAEQKLSDLEQQIRFSEEIDKIRP